MCVMMDAIFVFQQDNLSFPLICPDWNADEEMLLLEVFNLLIFSSNSISNASEKPASNITCSFATSV